MSAPQRAVFLSYASQDSEAARRLCTNLRAAGIEVWFDQSELRGGDVWDQKIRKQIQDCTLFIPIISAHTDERSEGYFRLEWKLAVDRSHLMADDAPFLIPVVIDDTPEPTARVPDRFRAVQWTRLPAGEAPPGFSQRVGAFLAGTAKPVRVQQPISAATFPRRGPRRWLWIGLATTVVLTLVAVLSWRLMSRPTAGAPTAQTAPATPASVIPAHSIAVLPFVDESVRRDQEYFSDGLSEALLNLLSKVPGMQVAARTSAFSFKGHAVDVRTIGRQLMVAHVLEGTVRKVGNHLRITAQLERADTGYQIWSESYDRELGDVFHIQDEIANAVVKALKVSLLGNAAPQSQGTRNSEAYLVFLQGRAKMEADNLASYKIAATDFERSLKLDPNYAPAYVELASAKLQIAEFEGRSGRLAAFESTLAEARLLLEQALRLDPNDAQAYVVRGYLRSFHDHEGAEQDYRRGIELNPNSARAYSSLASSLFADPIRRDEALAMITRAQRLDPLQPAYQVLRAMFLILGRANFREADELLLSVVARYPLYAPGHARLAFVRRMEGKYADAIMYSEQALKLDPLDDWTRRLLALDYSDLADPVAAGHVADEAPVRLPVHRLTVWTALGDWHQAATVSYAAIADETMDPATEPEAVFALRMEARRTHDYGRARVAFERMCDLTWNSAGVPTLPPQLGFGYASVAVADMLLASGERARADRLLRVSLVDMDHVAHELKRGEAWYVIDKATAMALLGDRKSALAALHKAVAMGYGSTWSLIELDPAFDLLRGDAEFQNLMREIKTKVSRERELLAAMRADGRVPDRSGPAAAGKAPTAPP